MADISKLEQQADLLMQNVMGWENSTLQRIGKRIKRYSKLSLADVKSINNIATVKQDMDAITKELAKVTGYNISQIEQMYGELLEEQHLANQPLYDYRGKTLVPFAENRELQAIARAYAKTTGETMINLAKTKALCIMGANGKPIGLQKYYTDVLDKAVMQVSTGATDFHTAMRDSIIELGGSGVRVDYGGGVTRRLDTVVRQNLLWGAKQASVEYNEMIGEELGCDGYEVDAHSSPRPSHMFVQGKQYCIGKSRTINGIKFIGFEETDPTSPDGKSASQALGEYGCLHYKTPILCGISEPRFSKEQLAQIEADNKKQYKVGDLEGNKYYFSQKMRSLEAAIREQKDIKAVAQASGDKALVKKCNERIKAYQGKYNEISEITGIQGDKKRMSVPRGTASVKGTTPTPKNKIDFERPVRPKRADFSTEEEFQKARAKYKEDAEKYEEKIDVWAKEQVPKTTMSKKDFELWATKHDVSIYGSIDGLDESVLGSWSKRFEKLSSDFPQVQEYYQKILGRKFEVSFNPSASFCAEASYGITFGGSFADMKSGAKVFGDGIAEGLFTKGTGTIDALYDHEFGHTLDSTIRFGKIKTTEQSVKYSNDIISSLYGKKGMSEYATTNADELFAEGFSAWYGGEKTEFAESFGELLKRWL